MADNQFYFGANEFSRYGNSSNTLHPSTPDQIIGDVII
jgi:hypothetical protein